MGCGASCVPVVEPLPQTPTDFFDEYILGAKLGKGSFAEVRMATKVTSSTGGKPSAVKILDLRDQESPGERRRTIHKRGCEEAAIWARAMSHINVVRLHKVFFDEDFCYFVMERCDSSLFTHLTSLSEVNERSIGSLLVQMCTSLSHVHSVGVVHRDVKPDNFLVTGQRGIVKLTDFGLSGFLPTNGKLYGVHGTAPFMCPEMISRKYYNETADVWSMAVVAYCLLFGEFPYRPKVRSSKAMKKSVMDGEPPNFEPTPLCLGKISKSAVEFVQALLEREPDQRPSAKDALKMPFMVAVVQNQHMNKVDLPSLRSMLCAAKKTGVFGNHDVTKKADIDPLLNLKHEARNELPLPDQTLSVKEVFGRNRAPLGREAAESCNSSNSNFHKNTSSLTTSASGNSKGRFSSNRFSPCNSSNSNLQKNTSSLTTSASDSNLQKNTSSLTTSASGNSKGRFSSNRFSPCNSSNSNLQRNTSSLTGSACGDFKGLFSSNRFAPLSSQSSSRSHRSLPPIVLHRNFAYKVHARIDV